MAKITDIDKPLRNVWRAYVSCPDAYAHNAANRRDELTLYVEANSEKEAHANMRSVISAIYPNLSADQYENSYYNLISAKELVENGISENISYRLFESGWRGEKVESWATAPIFAVSQPAEIFRAWSAAKINFESNSKKLIDQPVKETGLNVALNWQDFHIKEHKALANRIVKSIEKFISLTPFNDLMREFDDFRTSPSLFQHIAAIFQYASKESAGAKVFNDQVKKKTVSYLEEYAKKLTIEQAISVMCTEFGIQSSFAVNQAKVLVAKLGLDEVRIKNEMVRMVGDHIARSISFALRDKYPNVNASDVERLVIKLISRNIRPLPKDFFDNLKVH